MKYSKDLRMHRSHVNINMMVKELRLVDEILSVRVKVKREQEFEASARGFIGLHRACRKFSPILQNFN